MNAILELFVLLTKFVTTPLDPIIVFVDQTWSSAPRTSANLSILVIQTHAERTLCACHLEPSIHATVYGDSCPMEKASVNVRIS